MWARVTWDARARPRTQRRTRPGIATLLVSALSVAHTRGRSGGGQCHVDDGPLLGVDQPHGPAHRSRQRLDERHSQARGAATVARARGVAAHETIEHAVANLGRDAGTIIGDADPHHRRGRGSLPRFMIGGKGTQRNGDAGTRGRVHAGVREQVRENLTQGGLVAEHLDVRGLAELPRVVGGDHVCV